MKDMKSETVLKESFYGELAVQGVVDDMSIAVATAESPD
jgi:hypothetical protein